MQFAGDPRGVPGFGAALAPAHPGAVVGAHARGLGDLLLHPDPVGRGVPERRLKDHGRTALAYAIDVQLVVAHVHRLAGGRMRPFGTLGDHGLVNHPDGGENQ